LQKSTNADPQNFFFQLNSVSAPRYCECTPFFGETNQLEKTSWLEKTWLNQHSIVKKEVSAAYVR
jgi:hypothetical protein